MKLNDLIRREEDKAKEHFEFLNKTDGFVDLFDEFLKPAKGVVKRISFLCSGYTVNILIPAKYERLSIKNFKAGRYERRLEDLNKGHSSLIKALSAFTLRDLFDLEVYSI